VVPICGGAIVGGRNGCAVVGVVAGEGFGYAVAEVVAGEGFDPTELPVFAPDDRERRGYIVARRLARSLLMLCLRALARQTAACLLKMDSCSIRSLSISCWTLASSSSTAALSSSTSLSQSWIWT
jgi:hypothetical protein